MKQSEEENSEFMDPFDGGAGTSIALLITQMRIYDTLMALLAAESPETSSKLHSIHEQGGIIGSYPSLSGEE